MKHVHYNYVEPMKAGSFYYSDGTYSNVLDKSKTCIGVCVIPSNFLPDGKARIMSLKEMDYNNPESGSLQHVEMYFGQFGVNTKIENKTTFTTIDPNAIDSYKGTTIGYNTEGYLPTDRKDDVFQPEKENKVDKGTTWHKTAGVYLPSPYMVVNGKEVLCPQYNSGALSDFDGKGNTDILTKLHTVEDWKTVDKITNGIGSDCATAAVCCARYKTEGTQSGDWYLPSIGELGFIMPRFNEIQGSLQALGSDRTRTLTTSLYYWSSSEYSNKNSFLWRIIDGYIYPGWGKNYSNSIFAFLMV